MNNKSEPGGVTGRNFMANNPSSHLNQNRCSSPGRYFKIYFFYNLPVKMFVYSIMIYLIWNCEKFLSQNEFGNVKSSRSAALKVTIPM